MAGIDEYLKLHPELADKDPVRVAQFVYDTEIKASGADRSRFEEYFLGAPVKSDDFFGDEAEDWGITKAGKSMARGIGNAIKGDAAKDLPAWSDMKTADNVGDVLHNMGAGIFGNEKDEKANILRKYPETTFTDDGNGNEIFTLPDGRQGYIRQPGFDSGDLARTGATMAAFLPAAGAAGMAGKAAGFGARVAAGGVAAAGTDAALQKAAGRDEIDGGQVALTGALGAGGEAAAPAIGKVVGKVMERFGWDKWSRMSESAQRRAIATQLTDDGFKPEDFAGMTRAQVIEFGTKRVKQKGLVKPHATIADDEFGYKMTRGQVMPEDTAKQRAAKFAQASKEEMLKSSESGQRFRDLDANNVAKTDENISTMASKFSGGAAQADTSMEAAGMVHDGLRNAAASLKSKVDDAYSTARGFDANLMADTAMAVPDRVRRALDAADVVLDDLTPAGSNAMKMLQKAADSMNVPNGRAKDVPIQQIERMRRRVATFYDKASTNEDRRAVQVIKSAYDDALDEAIDAQMFTGDVGALDALKDARKLHAEYSRKFRGKDEAGKAVQKMLDIEATPEQVANYMIGVNGLSKAGSARVAKRYGEIVGKDSAEYNALREMLLYTVARRPTGEAKGAQALVSTLKKSLDGQGSSLIKELYTPDEQAALKRFSRALEATLPNGDFARSSGTAERMLRFYQSGGFKEFPGMKMIIGLIDNSGANKALSMPTLQHNPISGTPLLAGGNSGGNQ